ncbi:MAG: hypothetical protein ACJ8AI_01570, partial [Rhodopila sp.]
MLMVRHGGYVSIPELKRIVGPGCLSARAIGSDDACEIHFPQIETPRARAKGGAHTEITAGRPLIGEPDRFPRGIFAHVL